MKRKISVTLVIIFMMTLGLYNFNFRAVNADALTISDLVNKVDLLYQSVDSNDKTYIRTVKNAIAAMSDSDWNTFLDSTLITPAVIERLGNNEDTARASITAFLKDLMTITYNGDKAALTTTLETFKTNHTTFVGNLFPDVTVDNILQLMLDAETTFPTILTTQWKTTLTSGTNAEVLAIMPDIMKATFAKALVGSPLDGKLPLGWSTNLLVDKALALINQFDPQKNGQLSILKALVRSESTLTANVTGANLDGATIDGLLHPVVNYNLDILGDDASTYVAWDSSNKSVADFSVGQNANFQLSLLSNGTTTITAYRLAPGTTSSNDWIVKAFTITVTGINTTYGDPINVTIGQKLGRSDNVSASNVLIPFNIDKTGVSHYEMDITYDQTKVVPNGIDVSAAGGFAKPTTNDISTNANTGKITVTWDGSATTGTGRAYGVYFTVKPGFTITDAETLISISNAKFTINSVLSNNVTMQQQGKIKFGMYGDIITSSTSNGVIDSKDLAIIKRNLAGLATLTQAQFEVANIVATGTSASVIDSKDLAAFKQYLSGLIQTFGVQK